MLRWLATAILTALFVLNAFLPSTGIGRRGNEAQARADIDGARGLVGETLPALAFQDLQGNPVALADFRGKRTVLTFERSVDW